MTKSELDLARKELGLLQQKRDSIVKERNERKITNAQAKRLLDENTKAITTQEKAVASLDGKYKKNLSTLREWAQKSQSQGTQLSQRKEQLEKLGQSLDKITQKQKIYNGIQDRKARMGETFGEMRGAAISAAPAFLAMGASLKASAEYRVEMTRIGNTADMTREQSRALGDQLLNESVKIGVATANLQEGLGEMVAGGIDPRVAINSVSSMGNVIKAYKADAKDVGSTNLALINNMGYTAEGLTRPWDMLASAANQGNFELKDIAKSIPAIGSAMKALKVGGDEGTASMGAWLQIAKRGAGSADEAANNYQNFLQKVTAKDSEKNAQKMGFSLRDVVAQAQKEGKNPIDAAIAKIKDVTGGDQVKIGELFADAQVQNFLRPAIQGWDEYQKIKENALKGNGTVDKDASKVSQEMAAKSEKAGAAWQRFKVKFGDALAPLWGKVLTGFAWGMTKLGSAIDKMGAGWTQAIAAIGGGLWLGFMGWKIWTIAKHLRKIFSFGRELKSLSDGVSVFAKVGSAFKKLKDIGSKGFSLGKMIRLKGFNLAKMLGLKSLNIGRFLVFKGASGLMSGLRIIGSGLSKVMHFGGMLARLMSGGLVRGMMMAGRAVMFVGRALLMNPIGLIITGIAIAGYLVYKNWDKLKPMFISVWNTAKTKAVAAWNTIKSTWGGIKAWFSAKIDGVKSIFKNLPSAFAEFGRNMIQGLIDGVTARWDALKSKISGLASMVSNVFTKKTEINSPSRLFARHGGHLMDGLGVGIGRNAASVLTQMGTFARALGGAFAPKLRVPAPDVSVAKVRAVSSVAARSQGTGGASGSGVAAAGNNEYHFHITQAQGEDAESLARRIMRMVQDAQGARRRSYMGDFA